jgi:hypothetical protein
MFTIVLALRREPAVDFPVASLMELLKVTRPARRQTIGVKQPETAKRRVALMAAPPADLSRRLVGRALPNFDLQPKLTSKSRLAVQTQMAPGMLMLHHPARPEIRALQSDLRARVFCSPNR